MKQIALILLLVACSQYTNAMRQEQAITAKRKTLTGAAEARINPQAQQPKEHIYDIASLAGLPVDLQKEIALQILTGNLTIKERIQSLFKLAFSNKQLFNLLTTKPFLKQVKKLIKQKNRQAELNSLLFYYSHVGNIHAVTLLLNIGADVNSTDYYDDTALMYAVMKWNTEIVRTLLAAGANPNHYSRQFDISALMNAFMSGCNEIVEALLAAGADVESIKFGYTNLMLAATQGHTQVVRTLLAAGADVNATDLDGKTVLNHAHESENQEVIQLIQDAIDKR